LSISVFLTNQSLLLVSWEVTQGHFKQLWTTTLKVL